MSEPAHSNEGATPMGAEVEDTIGYHVQLRDGLVLGSLAWLAYDEEDGHIEALMIHPLGWRGVMTAHERRIPIDLVISVDHRLRHIVVDDRAEGAPA